jgi:hypothetical protein
MESVRAFACPVCRGFVPFESRRCPNCLAEFGFHVPSRTMVATSSGTAVIDGQIWIACTKAASLGCNWLVPQEQELGGQHGRCLADSLIRREPDTDDTVAVEKLVSTGIALRRLICQLIDIGLPVDPFWRLLEDWKWLSLCFNRVNTAMGKNPLYPFDIPQAVVRKLTFVHKVIRETARTAAAGGAAPTPKRRG